MLSSSSQVALGLSMHRVTIGQFSQLLMNELISTSFVFSCSVQSNAFQVQVLARTSSPHFNCSKSCLHL